MPELPEVETVCRGLALRLTGRILTRVHQHRANLREPMPERLPARLEGRRVALIRRRAKYILIELDDGWVLLIHLGMTGRMLISVAPATAPGRHDHVVLETDDGGVVTFNDARRFGLIDLIEPGGLATCPRLADLGPEPLEPGFTGPLLAARLAGRRRAIKEVLLDQTVLAGLGNIYAAEALFHAGIDPRRPAASVSAREAGRLVKAIRQVLQAAIKAGGSSLRDYVQSDGELGYFQSQFAVYDREGQACPGCSCEVAETGGVVRLVQGNRSTFYCPRRQG